MSKSLDPAAFLSALFEPAKGGFVSVCGPDLSGKWRDDLEVVAVSEAASLELGGVDDYFTVHPRATPTRGVEANTSSVVAVVIDFDGAKSSSSKAGTGAFETVDDVLGFVEESFEFSLSAIVDSGHGFHGYFFLKEPLEPLAGKELLARLKQHVQRRALDVGKSLDSVFDLSRVMRLPGSINGKGGGRRPTSVVELHPERRYDVDDFDFLPKVTDVRLNADVSHVSSEEIEGWIAGLPEGAAGEAQIADWCRELQGATPGSPDGGRHATALALVGRASVAAATGSVSFRLAVRQLSEVFEEVKPGHSDEFDRMVSYVVGQRLPDPADNDRSSGTPRLTDAGNSTRLIQLHGDRLRYIPVWNKWIVWAGHRWAIDHNNVLVTELAKDVSSVLDREESACGDAELAKKIASFARTSAFRSRIAAMIELARGIHGVPVSHRELDTDPWLLGVENGVIDLKTGLLRDGDPKDLMIMQAPITHDAGASCPTWDRCMREWFPDEEVRRYVQRLAGAALVGEQRDHDFVIHYGGGGNGKGTFVRAIGHVLGEYFVVPHKALLTVQKYAVHDTERAALFRKRLGVASETERRVKLNEAEIKNLTGGDVISARRMREDPWDFQPSHALWLMTNYLPEIAGTDAGIWRRVRVVPWKAEFEGSDVDSNLDEKLRDEAAGILNWMVAGCLDYQELGLDPPEAVADATKEYRESEDTLGRFAADTGLEFREGNSITSSDLNSRLRAWGDREGLRVVPSPNEVAEWLKRNGATKRRQTQHRKKATVWKGVGVVAQPEDTPDTPPQFPPEEETAHTKWNGQGVSGVSGSGPPVIPSGRSVNWEELMRTAKE